MAPEQESPQQAQEAATAAASEHDPVAVEDAEPVDGVHGTTEPPADETGGEQVEHDLDELIARASKADEYLALAQRTQADFENFRKRMARDVGVAESRGVAKLARELLPALDNLGRALAAVEAGEEGDVSEHLTAGVKLVHGELLAALARVGIEPFSPQGEPFDPQQHEAIVQQPVEGAASGTVVEVYQQGFRHGDAVLRPARVVVAA